jgi:hypothetical protein
MSIRALQRRAFCVRFSSKIPLANHYNFVMMRATYGESILFLRDWPIVALADRVRIFGLFRF